MLMKPHKIRLSKNKKILLVILVALLVIVGVITSQASSPWSWRGQDAVTVYGSQYEDPCRLVTDDQIKATLPDVITPTTSLNALYVSRSIPKTTKDAPGISVRCLYQSYGQNDAPDPQLQLGVTYFANNETATKEWQTKTGDAIRANTAVLQAERQKAVDTLANPNLSPTDRTFTQQTLALADAALKDNARNLQRFEGAQKVTIAGHEAVFIPYDSTYYIADKSRLIAVQYVPDPNREPQPFYAARAATPAPLVQTQKNIETLIATLLTASKSRDNVSKPSDGIRAQSGKIASTKFYDPCKLLSAELYKNATGANSDSLVQVESTTSRDLEATPRVNGKVVLERNACTRTSSNASGKVQATFMLEMQYAATATDATELYQEYRRGGAETKLSVGKNETVSYFVLTNYDGMYSILSRKGPYVIQLAYTVTPKDGASKLSNKQMETTLSSIMSRI